MDLNRTPEHGVPKWSETRWGGCFNPEQGVGLYLHAGRLRGELEWWWAQTAIYLPDGRVAVERSWVHRPDPVGVATPSLDLRMRESGWSARFDGIVEDTTTEALGRGPRGASAPSVPATFDIIAEGTRPWWDMFAGRVSAQDFGDMHVEQLGQSTGELRIGGQSFRLDGVSYFDHSSGPRDWTHFHSHNFAMVAMPDHTLHAGRLFNAPGQGRKGGGVWFTADGQVLRIVGSEMPPALDVLGAPQLFDWVIVVKGLGELTYRVEVLHTFSLTITDNNDNINGCDWDVPGDPLYMTECQVKVTAPDGSIGYGHIERSVRRSSLEEVRP